MEKLPAGRVDVTGSQSVLDKLRTVDRPTESLRQLAVGGHASQARADAYALRLAGKSAKVAHSDSDPLDPLRTPSPDEAIQGMSRVEEKESKIRNRQ